jgi:hypothetical protein
MYPQYKCRDVNLASDQMPGVDGSGALPVVV